MSKKKSVKKKVSGKRIAKPAEYRFGKLDIPRDVRMVTFPGRDWNA